MSSFPMTKHYSRNRNSRPFLISTAIPENAAEASISLLILIKKCGYAPGVQNLNTCQFLTIDLVINSKLGRPAFKTEIYRYQSLMKGAPM